MLTGYHENFIHIILLNNNFIVKGKVMESSKIHVEKRIFPRRVLHITNVASLKLPWQFPAKTKFS